MVPYGVTSLFSSDWGEVSTIKNIVLPLTNLEWTSNRKIKLCFTKSSSGKPNLEFSVLPYGVILKIHFSSGRKFSMCYHPQSNFPWLQHWKGDCSTLFKKNWFSVSKKFTVKNWFLTAWQFKVHETVICINLYYFFSSQPSSLVPPFKLTKL